MEIKRETLERAGRISVLFFRGILIALLAIILFFRCRMPIREEDAELMGRGISIVNAAISVLFFQTIVRTLHVHDRRTRDFVLSKGKASKNFFRNACYAFADVSFWFDIGFFVLFSLPIVDLLPPYLHFRRTFFDSLPKLSSVVLTLTPIIMYILFFLASLVAYHSTRRAWLHYAETEEYNQGLKSGEVGWRKIARRKRNNEHNEIVSVLVDLAIAFLVYYVAPVAVFAPIILAVPIIAIFWYYTGLLVFALVFVVTFFAVRYLRAIRKRRIFVRDLTRICKEKNIPLSPIVAPCKSLFTDHVGENFSLEYKGQRYDCKLLGAFSRFTPFIFSPDGYAICRRNISFGRRNIPLMTSAGRQMYSATVDLFHIDTQIDLAFSGKGKKIVILLPIPHSIFLINAVGGLYPLDTGDRVGDFQVYNASGFLGALERDFLGRH